MGAGSDLQVYHDGSDSHVADNGTGRLLVRTNGTSINFFKDTSETMAVMNVDGAVELYHDNSKKLETASTGIDITGAFTATAASTITTTGNEVQLTLKSTDADAVEGPTLDLVRDSASPAAADNIGLIRFLGEDSAGNNTVYAEIHGQIENPANGSEDAAINFEITKGSGRDNSFKIGADEVVVNEASRDVDFRVESDNNASALFVKGANGNVGIRTQAPDARLEIHDGGATSNTQLLQIHSDSSSFSSHLISLFAERNTTNSTFNAIRYFNTGASANRFIVRDSGNVENTNNSYGAISDETVKKNITDAASQWDDIKALTVRKFHLNEQDDTDPKMIGVVAQEIEKVSAGLVTTAYDEGEERDIKTVKYSVLYMKAVKALQEAMTRIETLEAKVKALEAG
jgi:hypothetical protein